MNARNEVRMTLSFPLPNDARAALELRAAELNMSLTAYCRELLLVLAEEPTIAANLLDL